MAKRKRRREPSKFEHWTEVTGIILMVVSILAIVPKPMGIVLPNYIIDFSTITAPYQTEMNFGHKKSSL